MCIDMITALPIAWKGSKVCSIGRPLAAVAAVVLMLSLSVCADTNTLPIAVIGSLSGKDRAGGRSTLDGVNLDLLWFIAKRQKAIAAHHFYQRY
jgi:hypothetical protein